MEFNTIIEKLKVELDETRFIHSVNVMETAITLAKKYGIDIDKARYAGILHDCGKNYKREKAKTFIQEIKYNADEIEWRQTQLLHGIIGEYLAKTLYEVNDDDILGAIRWHTTGRAGMTTLEKIIYVADYIEPLRNFEGIENMRRAAYEDLDYCVLLCADSTIKYILRKGVLLHPKTVETRNHSVMLLQNKNAILKN